ncbi:S1C family serine protease [Georgenia yuyongxinii]|uniref:PDZ domain-containing protein n=1 Tax=Georgenia yuyongxinii TaxID=2589797 RepID=A0A552WKQ6_9MICO|nr:trypsin-like peptidase domain-containing protein [Georgenia yuyongxinii]TRW43316.1 PDZ domain-containing protein [Georgenia yuyongxinii]
MSTNDQQPRANLWSAPTPGAPTHGATGEGARSTGTDWNNPYRAPHNPYGGPAGAPAQPSEPGRPAAGHPSQAGSAFGAYDAHGNSIPPGGPGGSHGTPGGAPAGPGGRRRRPTWVGLVATAAGAAVLASVGTAGLTGAFDEPTPTAATSASAQSSSGANAAPVVTSTTDNPDWANVAAAVRQSVVAIDVRTASGEGAGSGVIVDSAGHILTNDHVVGDAVDGGIRVTLFDGRMYEATVAGTDPATDLAVITLTDPPKDLKPATLGNSDDVIVGDPVAAVGNPLGLSSTVTTGIVSAIDRPVQTTEQNQGQGQQGVQVVTNAIQVDAAINPGNSGGPLFDAAGRVIGINSSIASMPTASGQAGNIGLGFAIPSNLVKQVAEQLIATGVAQHAYLGVTMQDGLATADGATRAGAQVQAVQPNTPAQAAGLQAGDVIVGIDKEPVDGALSLTGFVRQYASGDQVTLTVVRDGKTVDVSATLATREDQAS